ncbi:unnamed protein product [Enterobius vermicularis]|uniref:DUF418 domain-containing protein n=1 Tax=Enterobius vermicularis TaxID=51028 RepID=A0A0N4VKH9_ENTVE|nr:unnamed protein product [Enterobius vermicularis]
MKNLWLGKVSSGNTSVFREMIQRPISGVWVLWHLTNWFFLRGMMSMRPGIYWRNLYIKPLGMISHCYRLEGV